MRRKRKNYRIAEGLESVLGQPGEVVVNFVNASGALAQSFDFSIHAQRPMMAAELAFAFRNQLADKSALTRRGTFKCLRQWFRFLDTMSRQPQWRQWLMSIPAP